MQSTCGLHKRHDEQRTDTVPLWTSPACLQAQSPHPHLTHAFTYAHPKLQVWFTDTYHTSIPTCIIRRTFPHYSYHVYTLIHKNTMNEHLHTTKWEGPSHFHHNPISHTHSYSFPCFPCSIPHTARPPSLTCCTVCAHLSFLSCDTHTNTHFTLVSTHICLFTHKDAAGMLTTLKKSPLTL